MSRSKTTFNQPPKQTQRNKKLNAKFARSHNRSNGERLVSFRKSAGEPFNINDKANSVAPWSNPRYGW